MQIKGKTIKYGDDISTDLIIAGKYTKTLDLAELAEHAMADLDPLFKEKMKDASIVVAGEYFGCGSSREGAPVALREAGVKCVVAKSFARIFFRNAVNVGLPVLECNTDLIREGDEISFTGGDTVLNNLTTGVSIPISPMPEIMLKIFSSGGLVNFFRENGGF